MTSGQYDRAWYADEQDLVIYSFHMPLFFFLAGLFARRSAAKKLASALREKTVTIVYPYFLWSIVSVLLAVLAASAVNAAADPRVILGLWYEPVYQYWFLYALLICHVITILTRADWRITALLCAVSAVGVGTDIESAGMASLAFRYYVYFALGLLIAPWLIVPGASPAVLALVALVAALLFSASFIADSAVPHRALVIIRGATGSAATIAIAMLVARRSHWLAALGIASMAIYVLHTIFTAGTRIAFRALEVPNDLVTLVVSTAIGLFIPYVIWRCACRYRLVPMLGLGAQPRNWQGRAA